jgi:hypothetical protein
VKQWKLQLRKKTFLHWYESCFSFRGIGRKLFWTAHLHSWCLRFKRALIELITGPIKSLTERKHEIMDFWGTGHALCKYLKYIHFCFHSRKLSPTKQVNFVPWGLYKTILIYTVEVSQIYCNSKNEVFPVKTLTGRLWRSAVKWHIVMNI